jgi:predicted Abi (CAAX) family protease
VNKIRSWLLIVLGVLGIWLGWFWDQSILVNSKPTDSHRSSVISVVNQQLDHSIDRNRQDGNYRSNGEWIGRLILPSPAEIKKSDLVDWVWIEIKHAPISNQPLIGKIVRLWQPQPPLTPDRPQIITDIKFTARTIASQAQGNIHPDRLNGRSQVSSLQSLAGARPEDDLLVRLTGVSMPTDHDASDPIVAIDREPTQITGTLTGLVKILGNDLSQTAPLPGDCNRFACPNEYFDVQHYNLGTHRFDGQIDRIKIPQSPAKKSGLLPSSIRDLAKSPAGTHGWYLYGDRDPQGLFTVAAIQPRSLFELTPQREISDADDKLNYLNHQHWDHTPANKGKLSQVTLIDLQYPQIEKLGDKALVIHTFGGIGGKNGDDLSIWQTVTGHFAYGLATVRPSTFTGELEWEIDYNQVYAHNPDGIVAGKQDWATYLGHLQRGWLATRPVADILINYPPVTTDYDFGGIKLSPLTELQQQLQIAAARYRTGDGTGSASVTPATSCVQDANQALYVTIQRLNQQVRSQLQIQAWLDAHPQQPQTIRFSELQALGTDLATNLAPLGIVRQDWQQNAAKLAGINADREFASSDDPIAGLISWRTMLPRGAQDGITKIFGQHGAKIWVLNTFQVGGNNPDIFPIAPTIIFGQLPLLSTVVIRLWTGLITFPDLSEWLSTMGLLCAYAIVALTIGFKSKFLKFSNPIRTTKFISRGNIRDLIQLLLMPALAEELVFRLLLVPHPIETATSGSIYLWSGISLGLFTIYHPLNAWLFYRVGNPTFMDWRFLTLAGLLGGICTIAYLYTGSIWAAVLMHWIVVVVWLKLLGGDRRLAQKSDSADKFA